MMILLLFFACDSLKSVVSEHYPQDYAPEAGVALAAPKGLNIDKVAKSPAEITDLHFPFNHDQRMLVATKGGTLYQFDSNANGYEQTGVVFSANVRTGSEQGLLGVALHPNYSKNGLLYVHLNPTSDPRRTEISEWSIADTTSPLWKATKNRVLLTVPQPYANHNGGQIRFGPDGFLYIALGDGGWRDDPKGHGQNWSTLLGGILRIDPTSMEGKAYSIPSDNPYIDKAGARPELYAVGLRNPWRFTFTADGDLLVADVGQNAYEEVNLVRKGDNLGWDIREGRHDFEESNKAAHLPLVDPVFEYAHSMGQSITGGEIVSDKSSLDGDYIFADFVSGRFWKMPVPKARHKPVKATVIGKYAILPSTFGKDTTGRVYVADYGTGDIYRLSSQ